MTEFLQKIILPYLVYFQIITAIIITVYRYKLTKPILKVFVPFFWYAVLNEFIGRFYASYINVDYNLIVYNLYFTIVFFYLLTVYRLYIKNKIVKKTIIIFMVLYTVCIGYELFFLKVNYFEQQQTVAYVTGGVFILISVLLYFFEELSSNEIIQIDRKIIFWISIAYFFYYIAMVLLKVGQNFYAVSSSHRYLFNVLIIMTLLMNLILIFGFIWSKKEEL